MNIFVLNRGSSTIKCYFYRDEKLLWEGMVQWKNEFENPVLTIKGRQKEALQQKSAAEALTYMLKFLPELPDAVGHRIVHGGNWFTDSVLITEEVKEKIKTLSELAPLHNLAELEGIEILAKHFPRIPQVAVFDTAFHHTLPKFRQVYPIPYHWYEEGIRRYGFHGISYQYCTRRAAELVKNPSKMVICHLGSGASLCAVKEGKSIDTTMGFTPLEGLMMDTRCGTIDPGILLHLLEKKSVAEVSKELYNQSGLLGISGSTSDMRDILQKSSEGDSLASLALEVYLHRLNSLIGSMAASLQGIDTLVFTAGIGENAPLLRRRVCENFSFLGIELDPTQNERNHTEDALLSNSHSKVRILLIHTQEAMEIARQCLTVVKKTSSL